MDSPWEGGKVNTPKAMRDADEALWGALSAAKTYLVRIAPLDDAKEHMDLVLGLADKLVAAGTLSKGEAASFQRETMPMTVSTALNARRLARAWAASRSSSAFTAATAARRPSSSLATASAARRSSLSFAAASAAMRSALAFAAAASAAAFSCLALAAA